MGENVACEKTGKQPLNKKLLKIYFFKKLKLKKKKRQKVETFCE